MISIPKNTYFFFLKKSIRMTDVTPKPLKGLFYHLRQGFDLSLLSSGLPRSIRRKLKSTKTFLVQMKLIRNKMAASLMDWFLPKYEATFQTISSEVDQSFQVGVELFLPSFFWRAFDGNKRRWHFGSTSFDRKFIMLEFDKISSDLIRKVLL